MSQYVYTCACGWRGLTLGGVRFRRGAAPTACPDCRSAALVVSIETHPRVTRICACGTAFLSTSRVEPPRCVKCRGRAASAAAWASRGGPRYRWTEDKDAYLRKHYDSRVRGRVSAIARVFGWPGWVVKKRAARLSLATPMQRRDWTPAEVAFVEDWTGSRTSHWIAKRLKRTESSIAAKQKHLNVSRRVRDGYTCDGLALCFGVDAHVIARWIRDGKLTARRRGTARQGKQGDIHKITDDDVRAFLRDHPTTCRLDKVEQGWFLDLVLGAPRPATETRREYAKHNPKVVAA